MAFTTWSPRARWIVGLGALAALGILAWHVAEYFFLTDDAFISFRYARNLSEGYGLVYNPGFERVEGYTNFLWVLLLAGLHAIGIQPEIAAHVLSILATILLWGLVAWFAIRNAPGRGREWLVLFPLLALSLTRSFAVWATSGLETRLFEVLVVAAMLRLVLEIEALLEGRQRHFLAGWLFALATLTRPDGLLIAATALGIASLILIFRREFRVRRAAAWLLPYIAVVGSHFLFRRLYYHEWLPNTYYAKVAGRTWWESGANYFAGFALEYAAYLWVPLLLAAFVLRFKNRTPYVPILFATIVLAHGIYVASIGGDHFEYRPLTLYFPFLFLLLYDGARYLAGTKAQSVAVGAYLVVILIGLWQLPHNSHVQFPSDPAPAFPRRYGSEVEGAAEFLDPDRDPIYRLPGLREIAKAHKRRLQGMTDHFVGLRQEEFRHFLERVRWEGRKLRQLVDAGQMPADAYVATHAAGTIPYYSRLRTLDRLGLTDATIARQSFYDESFRFMAHGKEASIEYARHRGVELWPPDPVHLLHRVDSERLLQTVVAAQGDTSHAYAAAYVGDDHYLLAELPLGYGKTLPRFTKLDLRPCRDPVFVRSFAERAIPAYESLVEQKPADWDRRFALARLLLWTEAYRPVVEQCDILIAQNPGDMDVWFFKATSLKRLGEDAAAEAALRACLEIARQSGNTKIVGLIEAWLREGN